MDEGLEETITSLIWCAPRLASDCPELKVIADQFAVKFGKQYCQAAVDNQFGTVNQKLMRKLNVQAPKQVLVEQYLVEIAKNFNVNYEVDPRVMQEIEGPLIELGQDASRTNIDTTLIQPPHVDANSIGFGPVPPGSASAPGHLPYPSNTAGLDDITSPTIPPPTAGPEAKPESGDKPPSYPSQGLYPNNTPPPPAASPEFPELPSVPRDDDDAPGSRGGGGGGTADPSNANDSVNFESLARRFEQLKKK